MDQGTWQNLLALESRDVVVKWFNELHGRELNARRSKEILAAAKQAREFFKNAAAANFSVKPLLTFYGVASLSRSLTLLFRREGGEDSLAKSHGLEAVAWSNTLSGDTSIGLSKITELRIRTCAGLFNDLLNATDNWMTMHARSSSVDWRVPYLTPTVGFEFTLEDLITRLPDLVKDYSLVSNTSRIGYINEMTFSEKMGFVIKTQKQNIDELSAAYSKLGYTCKNSEDLTIFSAPPDISQINRPQFVHAYVDKMFGSIPRLYLAVPLSNGVRYSQLLITYMLSYFLGMLARYFPTHWISLIQGEKGDALWPAINRAHHYVDYAYPELVFELIVDTLEQRRLSGNSPSI